MLLRLTMTSKRWRRYKGFFVGFDHGVNLFLVYSGHQVLIFVDFVVARKIYVWININIRVGVGPIQLIYIQEEFHICRQVWQDWLEVGCQYPEHIECNTAYLMQLMF